MTEKNSFGSAASSPCRVAPSGFITEDFCFSTPIIDMNIYAVIICGSVAGKSKSPCVIIVSLARLWRFLVKHLITLAKRRRDPPLSYLGSGSRLRVTWYQHADTSVPQPCCRNTGPVVDAKPMVRAVRIEVSFID